MALLSNERSNKPSLHLGLIYFVVFLGFNVWRATFHNYAVDTLKVSETQIGFLFSITAIPGLLTFSIGLLSSRIKIIFLLISTFLLSGIGFFWISFFDSWGTIGIGVFAIAGREGKMSASICVSRASNLSGRSSQTEA